MSLFEDFKNILEKIADENNWNIWRDDNGNPIGVVEWIGEYSVFYEWDKFLLYQDAKKLLKEINKDIRD